MAQLVSDITVQYAESVARRVHDRAAPVRWGFVRNFGDDRVPAPATFMLRGGRGGAVRLKVYLSFLWFAAAPPHDVTYPARAWAGLIGLDDPETNGARRVVDAIDWLDRNSFVATERRAGRPSEVRLLSELGDGTLYELPGGLVDRAREAGVDERQLKPHFYMKLRKEFWTCGWISVLSGPAIVMYLSLLVELGEKPIWTEVWLSPSEADKRLGLSEESRGKGLRELEKFGLVERRRRPVGRDVFDFRRLRNVYVLQEERLSEVPVGDGRSKSPTA